MAAKNKVLWTVRLPSIHNFLLQAQAAKVTAVAIRTTENNLSESIPAFHDAGMRVFGWRFPPIRKSVALDQAQHVVDLLQMGYAEISLVYFPGSRSSLKEKSYYDEVMHDLLLRLM